MPANKVLEFYFHQHGAGHSGRGMEWLQTFGWDQIEQHSQAISLHWLGVMREEGGLSVVMCDV